ncbi:predicted protein [Botrytis cinerea T4]|uniref:Uncharacterized protein n=1 Tax=Botryotinia fuckeliana (strain T4) TaxID=999810 RepID=G2XTA3_BOTF4|nr:predicted protein [Botrytis cinerea T4]
MASETIRYPQGVFFAKGKATMTHVRPSLSTVYPWLSTITSRFIQMISFELWASEAFRPYGFQIIYHAYDG